MQPRPLRARQGFSLVLSMVIMAMMVLVIVVLASFLRVESSVATAKQAEAAARLNALAAVRLAGAALQERLGPDTRVSAPATIFTGRTSASANFGYQVLGAWRSWEGLDHDTRSGSRYAGRPQAPDYTSKLKIYHPTTAPTARFLGWMVSDQIGYGGNAPTVTVPAATPTPPPTVTTATTRLPLVGPTTDSAATRQVYVEPVSFVDGKVASTTTDGSQGYFSWWVGGENQKVRVVVPSVTPTTPANPLEWSQKNKTFGVPDLAAKIFGVTDLAPTTVVNAVTYPTATTPNVRYTDDNTLNPLGAKVSFFHDVSLYSEGLLTNTATGGFRKDLSLFTETWDLATSLDSSRTAVMPLFRVKPAKLPTAALSNPDYDLLYKRPLPDNQLPAGIGNRKRHTLPYWWADYGSLGGASAGIASDGGTNFGGYSLLSSFPPIRSWAFLTDHCLHYRKYVKNPDATLPGVVEMLPPQASTAATGNYYNYYERVFRHPVIARIQYVFATAVTGPSTSYTPAFIVQPVVTLWNPFNVRLTVPTFKLNCKWGTLPIFVSWIDDSISSPSGDQWAIAPTVNPAVAGTQSVTAYKFSNSTTNDFVTMWVGGNASGATIALEPGQTRVFSIPSAPTTIFGAALSVGSGITDIKIPTVTGYSPPSYYDLLPGYVASGNAGWRMTLPIPASTKKYKYSLSKGIEIPYKPLNNVSLSTSLARDGIYYDYYPVNYGTSGYSPVRNSFVGVTSDQFNLLYGTDQIYMPADPNFTYVAQTTADTGGTTTSPPNPLPFGTFAFGLRLSNDGITNYTGAVRNTNGVKTVSKGALQVSPFTTYTELGQKSAEVLTAYRYANSTVTDTTTVSVPAQVKPSDVGYFTSTNSGVQYSGARNPLNAPYDLYFYVVNSKIATGWSNPDLPQANGVTKEGFIVTASNATGLSKAVVAELPVKPLQSLAGLQSCDIRATNPAPPFSFGIIGNADASPVLPADDVVGRWIEQSDPLSTSSTALRSRDQIPMSFLQYDDSYCLNHLFFDDWFVSSIAPLPTDWASLKPAAGAEFTWDANVMVSLKKNWASFTAGTSSLPNLCYQPTTNASLLDLDVRSALNTPYSGNPSQPVAYQRVAASLRVPGQFNVNSTSVSAWRAMLGNLRSTKVPCIKPADTSVSNSSAVDNPLARMAISHEGSVTTGGNSPAVLGFSALTDAQLDRLATEIVREIKVRGPFLSLSEFINRQLLPNPSTSSQSDPCLRGTIASALRALEIIDISNTSTWNPAVKAQAVGKTTSKSADFVVTDNNLKPLKESFPLGDWKSVTMTPASTWPDYNVPMASEGHSTFGLPGWPRQADVLERLAPVISVRDDTFVVRAMGTSPMFNGTSARVWCEAVYQRLPEYVNSAVPAHEAPLGDVSSASTAGPLRVNVVLGRRIRLVSLRWLTAKDL